MFMYNRISPNVAAASYADFGPDQELSLFLPSLPKQMLGLVS